MLLLVFPRRKTKEAVEMEDKDPVRILEQSEEVKKITQLDGVMRVELEYYRMGGEAKDASHPIFVVFCNSSFRDRDKMPGLFSSHWLKMKRLYRRDSIDCFV